MRYLAFTLALLVSCPCLAQEAEVVDEDAEAETETAADETEAGDDEEAAPEPEASPEREEALQRYERAAERAEAGDYDAALAEFEEIYRLLEGDPQQVNVLYNIAVCQQELFRYDQAIESYRRYLDDAGEDAARADEVRASLRTLDGLLGTIEVAVDAPGARVWLGDRELGAAPGTFRVPAGTHVIEVRAPDRQPGREEVRVAARTTARVELALLPLAEEYRGLDPAFFAVTLGAGLASAVAGAILGGLALAAVDVPHGVTTDDRDRAVAFSIPADVLFGTAGVLGITAVVLAALTDWGGDDEGEGASAWIAPSGGGAAWRGRF